MVCDVFVYLAIVGHFAICRWGAKQTAPIIHSIFNYLGNSILSIVFTHEYFNYWNCPRPRLSHAPSPRIHAHDFIMNNRRTLDETQICHFSLFHCARSVRKKNQYIQGFATCSRHYHYKALTYMARLNGVHILNKETLIAFRRHHTSYSIFCKMLAQLYFLLWLPPTNAAFTMAHIHAMW